MSSRTRSGWTRHIGTLSRLISGAPLALALGAAGVLARRASTDRALSPHAGWEPGLSVVVPERGTPELLEETLEALLRALSGVREPTEVIVIVNGAERSAYAALREKHAAIDWQFHDQPLGYGGAISAGLARARHPWVYLLNSDMRLEDQALVQVMAQRRPWVFAVASQIFFTDPQRRREETGWSDFRANAQTPEMYERDVPPNAQLVRGSLYASGGSSLFRTSLLREFVRHAIDYQPFYWEDADWGIQAWISGWEVLFCPSSRAWHHHRATIARYYAAGEIERVIARNALLFDLRNAWTNRRAATLLRTLIRLDARSFAELCGVHLAWRVFQARLSTLRTRQHGLRFETLTTDRWYRPLPSSQPAPMRRPRVLLVSPFALFPPAHGGARRIAELVGRLHDRVEFLLLGDEGSLYGAAAEPWLESFHAVRLVEGRGDQAGQVLPPLLERMQRHSWPGLRTELERMIARHDPDIVQVEFMELAGLAATRRGRARWVLALHDVYLSTDPKDAAGDAPQIAALANYDALCVCSAEDCALLPAGSPMHLIGNGATDRRRAYQPSPETPRLLFMGPFRYAQNREGILEFLHSVWPGLRARFPELILTILGGAESAAIAAAAPLLRQPGIVLVSTFVEPEPFLAECTLTINPQSDIRGSSIKLIESLLAGRICVSTVAGARGFTGAGFDGLAMAANIPAMLEPIAALLADHRERHRRECADGPRLDAFTWNHAAEQQLALYRELVALGNSQ